MTGGSHGEKTMAHLRCSVCGTEATIMRNKGKLKKSGHVKHMWCFACQDRTAHIEIREW